MKKLMLVFALLMMACSPKRAQDPPSMTAPQPKASKSTQMPEQVWSKGLKKGPSLSLVDYEKRWLKELGQNLYGPDYQNWVKKGMPPEEWPELLKGAYLKVSEEVKTAHTFYNIRLPQLVVEVVKLRGCEAELSDPSFDVFLYHQRKHGSNYREITAFGDGPNGLRQIAITSSSSGFFKLWGRSYKEPLLVIDKMGHILTKQADGTWQRYPECSKRKD